MAFKQKTWKDRLVEFAGRRTLNRISGSADTQMVVDVTRNEGTVSQEGDAFSAANMNDLEQRVADEFANVNNSLTNVNVYVGDDDGKLHFVDSAGADSVLPFSGGWEEIKVVTLTSNLTIDIGRKPKEVLVGWSATNVTTKEFNLYYYYNEDFSSYGFGSPGVTINDNGVTISCKYSGRPVFYAYK